MQAKSLINQDIIRDGRYAIRVLTCDHLRQGISVVTEEFIKKQPLSKGFFKLNPNREEQSRKQWRILWESMSQEFFSNNLSVGLFDTENNNKLVGTLLGKNLHYYPKGFLENFKEDGFIKRMLAISQKLNENIREDVKDILADPQIPIVDIWGASIQDEHMGKKLLHKMFYAVNYLAFIQGYQYSFVWASNIKTVIAVKKLKYQQISRYNAQEYQKDGVKFFEHIEEEQKNNHLLLKKLQGLSGKQLPLTIEY